MKKPVDGLTETHLQGSRLEQRHVRPYLQRRRDRIPGTVRHRQSNLRPFRLLAAKPRKVISSEEGSASGRSAHLNDPISPLNC